MSYVQRVLQPGETVRHIATMHWIVYLPSLLFLIVALVGLGYAQFFAHSMVMFWKIAAGLVGLVGLGLLIPELFTWFTTEIAVTTHRLIYKTGFIQRKTNEMNMDKVESVRVDQSILGRILDYGDVVIIGTGEGQEKFRNVSNPIGLRNNITGV